MLRDVRSGVGVDPGIRRAADRLRWAGEQDDRQDEQRDKGDHLDGDFGFWILDFGPQILQRWQSEAIAAQGDEDNRGQHRRGHHGQQREAAKLGQY